MALKRSDGFGPPLLESQGEGAVGVAGALDRDGEEKKKGGQRRGPGLLPEGDHSGHLGTSPPLLVVVVMAPMVVVVVVPRLVLPVSAVWPARVHPLRPGEEAVLEVNSCRVQ